MASRTNAPKSQHYSIPDFSMNRSEDKIHCIDSMENADKKRVKSAISGGFSLYLRQITVFTGIVFGLILNKL
jgi:hypothetical protein